jgi:hypothetical protein
MNKDPVMVEMLDRYLDESEEDYISPEDRERDRQEYLADQGDYDED